MLVLAFSAGHLSVAIAENQPPAQPTAILERLAAEGFNATNSWLVGRFIAGEEFKIVPQAYGAADFPYRWDFNDGTLCGMTLIGSGLEHPIVKRGILCFRTLDQHAEFGWGDYEYGAAPLRFGTGAAPIPPLLFLKMRICQSVQESRWRAFVRKVDGMELRSEEVIVKGTNWQEIVFPFNERKLETGKQKREDRIYTGVKFSSVTANNNVEVDEITPFFAGGRPCFRKLLELPAAARFAKCSLASLGGRFKVYVNGALAIDSGGRKAEARRILNYELEPQLFREGKNAIGIETETGGVLLDAALVTVSGGYYRFDTGADWKFKQGVAGEEWTRPAYDDCGWQKVVVSSNNPVLTEPWKYDWFNPVYKGRIDIRPADGRTQPIYGGEDVVLKVSVPKIAGIKQEIAGAVYDEMGDGFHAFDKLVREGTLALVPEGNNEVVTIRFTSLDLPVNCAYAFVLQLLQDGKLVEKRRYEIVICGPAIPPPEAAPLSYTNGMSLKLVWELDAAGPLKPGEFVSGDSAGRERASRVVTNELGSFRQTYAGLNVKAASDRPGNFIAFQYHLERPGKPHVALAEFPDDSRRVQEMCLSESTDADDKTVIARDTVKLGFDHPLTHALAQHHVLFFPSQKEGTIAFYAINPGGWSPSMAARIGKIGIYEVFGDVPARSIADIPGARKWLAPQFEQGPLELVRSVLAGPIAIFFCRHYLFADAPYYYRNWLIAGNNLARRLQFAGENACCVTEYSGAQMLGPGEAEFHAASIGKLIGSQADGLQLLAKALVDHYPPSQPLAMFSRLAISGFADLTQKRSDNEIAAGAATFAQVDQNGRQIRQGNLLAPNWLTPAVQALFDKVIDNLLARYSREKGWKGIVLDINEDSGPAWCGAPDQASYDDDTARMFEKDTGAWIPVSANDPDRFRKRAEWLSSNAEAKEKWTKWRCEKMNGIYTRLGAKLRAARGDLTLLLSPSSSVYWDREVGDQTAFVARRYGLDLEALAKTPNLALLVRILQGTGQDSPAQRIYDADLLERLGDDGKNGISLDNVSVKKWPAAAQEAAGNAQSKIVIAEGALPAGDYFNRESINAFVRAAPALILHQAGQGDIMWMGRETEMAKFATAFRSLPAMKYRRLTGQGRDRNVWIGVGREAGQWYGYVANLMDWEVTAEVRFKDRVDAYDLVRNRGIDTAPWTIQLAPYQMATFRATGQESDPIGSCAANVALSGQTRVRASLEEAEKSATGKIAYMTSEQKQAVAQLIASVKTKLAEADFAAAMELLTSAPAADLLRREYPSTIPSGQP